MKGESEGIQNATWGDNKWKIKEVNKRKIFRENTTPSKDYGFNNSNGSTRPWNDDSENKSNNYDSW